MSERLALRPSEVAARIGVGVDTVQRWLLSGELPGTKGSVLIWPKR
jgi:excisionase family DNA binding protein